MFYGATVRASTANSVVTRWMHPRDKKWIKILYSTNTCTNIHVLQCGCLHNYNYSYTIKLVRNAVRLLETYIVGSVCLFTYYTKGVVLSIDTLTLW